MSLSTENGAVRGATGVSCTGLQLPEVAADL